MAKLETTLHGDFRTVLEIIENGILNGSMSASLTDASDFFGHDGSRCSTMVFERYSYTGGNRLSLTVTMFQGANDDTIHLSGIAAGGSQGLLFKINTFGEEAFLDKLRELLNVEFPD